MKGIAALIIKSVDSWRNTKLSSNVNLNRLLVVNQLYLTHKNLELNYPKKKMVEVQFDPFYDLLPL